MERKAWDVQTFREEVYGIVAAIPRGKVLTYGQVAWLAGRPRHARWVGRVLHGAPGALGLPCHRVVSAQGRTAPGWPEQAGLLRAEGVRFRPNGCVDLSACRWPLGGAEDVEEVGGPE